MKIRDANIEFLRVAMMYVIVLGHMSAMGPYSGQLAVHAVFSLSYFATNAFVFITGWYGLSFKMGKVWRLLGYGLFASLLLSSMSPIVFGCWRFNFSLGWFGNAYMALILVSPILNAGIETLHEKRMLNKAWMLLAAASFLSWMPLGSNIQLTPPGWSGNSTLAMLFIYISGRVAAHSGWVRSVNMSRALFSFVLLMIINIIWSAMALYAHGNVVLSTVFVATRCNNSPLTIALAFSVFLVFKSLRMPQMLGRMACFVSPSVMSIYLLHLGAFPEVSRALFYKYAFMTADSSMGKFASFVLAATWVYLICLTIDIVRRLAIQGVLNLFVRRECFLRKILRKDV